MEWTACDDANAAAAVVLPEATGRDNKYYQYFATITPNAGVSGDVTVSIKQFVDSVKPRSKEYLPLTAEQRIAVTLTTEQVIVRDARVANETLTVTVAAVADTTSVKALATAAYAARQVIYDANPSNERSLREEDHSRRWVPCACGDAGSGIEDPKANIADKKVTAASEALQ